MKGGKREGAGRKPNLIPSRHIVIHTTDNEYQEIIKNTMPRKRTLALLALSEMKKGK